MIACPTTPFRAAVDEFERHRPRRLAAAYRVTGSRTDTEDVVQDAWLRWAEVDHAGVEEAAAYLSVIASRLALNAVRARTRRRETYIGPWLPDPIVDDDSPEWRHVHCAGLGHALDVALSRMGPEQATAFVLRRVLDLDYDSIAAVLDTSPAVARQLVSRAGRAVADLERGDVDSRVYRDSRALQALLDTLLPGDVAHVAALLSAGSVLYSDGGDRAHAARRPIVGRERIVRFVVGISSHEGVRVRPAVVNGSAGLLVWEGDRLTTTVTLRLALDGLVEQLYLVRNPDKLAGIDVDPPPAR
ncbi:hypothetical protein F8O01_08510 [Pseudoclavibacter chungangensis]|uniref:Sigma-70 family RNA polymerase sigma factor n=1 Tax=Pseudoclavibacter chungangensis TaxID=587635 RepID=A0A7J5BSP9_9MICO|nr:sigma factor [Pseudoclavibacter chungangensis]KAB1657276.1 hypothetical protein F8O01_08510 [Pseudoclavibacter chungangensis]NYJ66277.1 RNA polymerase sigma-70 factor (ECF subfamily) [Pseudoclavibacter chungangensis]